MSNRKEYVFRVGPGTGEVQQVKAESAKQIRMESAEWDNDNGKVTITAYPGDILEGRFTPNDIAWIMDCDELIAAIVERVGILPVLERLRGLDDGDSMQNWCIDTYTRED